MNGRPRSTKNKLKNMKDVHTKIKKIMKLDQCLRFGRTPFTQIQMSRDLHFQKTSYKRYTSGGTFEFILILCNKDARAEYWFSTNSHERNVREIISNKSRITIYVYS